MGVDRRLTIRVVNTRDEFVSLQDQWRAILSTLREVPPFLTWEWMFTWWKVFNTNNTKLLILVVSNSSDIVAIAPLYIRTARYPLLIKTVYFLGTGEPEKSEVCSEYLDFISLPGYSRQVSEMVVNYFIRNNHVWNRMHFLRILEDASLSSPFIKCVSQNNLFVLKQKCGYRYFIKLPESWGEYIQKLSSSMRRSITNTYKKIDEKNSCEVKVVNSRADLDTTMMELIALHTESWGLKNKPGAFASREFREFHREIAELMLKNNMLQLMKIKLSGDLISVQYNFQIQGTSYYYQSGLNMKNYSALRPGVFMHAEAIKYSINERLQRYDFMMADEASYKRRYGCEEIEMSHIYVWNKRFRDLLLQFVMKQPYFRRIK